MLNIIKTLDSATIRGLIIATIPILVLIASFFGVDEALFQAKLEDIGEKIITLISLLVSLAGIAWAAYARVFKPTPPLTEAAQLRTAEMIASGKLTQITPPAAQKGFAHALMLGVLLAIGVVSTIGVAACTNTQRAIREADTPSDFALVFLEGYDAALKTANQLKTTGALSGANLLRVQQAELKAWPLVRRIDPLRVAYEKTKTAEDAAALQLAIDNAIREAAEFIRLIRELRDQKTV